MPLFHAFFVLFIIMFVVHKILRTSFGAIFAALAYMFIFLAMWAIAIIGAMG